MRLILAIILCSKIQFMTPACIILAKGGENWSYAGIFGGSGRDVAVASCTVKGMTTSSIREAIRAVLYTRTGRVVRASFA